MEFPYYAECIEQRFAHVSVHVGCILVCIQYLTRMTNIVTAMIIIVTARTIRLTTTRQDPQVCPDCQRLDDADDDGHDAHDGHDGHYHHGQPLTLNP